MDALIDAKDLQRFAALQEKMTKAFEIALDELGDKAEELSFFCQAEDRQDVSIAA